MIFVLCNSCGKTCCFSNLFIEVFKIIDYQNEIALYKLEYYRNTKPYYQKGGRK